jgi:hypothetical protein
MTDSMTGSAAGSTTAAVTAVPHLVQNLAPGFKEAPQFAQTVAASGCGAGFGKPASLVPHDLQNLASSRFSYSQFGHFIIRFSLKRFYVSDGC